MIIRDYKERKDNNALSLFKDKGKTTLLLKRFNRHTGEEIEPRKILLDKDILEQEIADKQAEIDNLNLLLKDINNL